MNPATAAVYLVALALAIKIALGAVQSGTFNQILAKFSIPPIPTAVFPWVGAGLGLAAGIVKSEQAGSTLSYAVAQSIVTLLTGSAAAMHLEFISGRDPVVGWKKKSGGNGGGSVIVKVDPVTEEAKKVPPVPPVAGAMWGAQWTRRAAVSAALGLSMMLVACGWWNSGGGGQVVTATEQQVACVLAQVEVGNVDPIAVAGACLGGTLADFVKIVESIFAYYTTPAPLPDAGPAPLVAGGLCGADSAAPPYPGAPKCLPFAVLANLHTMHDAAKTAIAAGAK
jgi:hypothetical protein